MNQKWRSREGIDRPGLFPNQPSGLSLPLMGTLCQSFLLALRLDGPAYSQQPFFAGFNCWKLAIHDFNWLGETNGGKHRRWQIGSGSNSVRMRIGVVDLELDRGLNGDLILGSVLTLGTL
ncbi:unnamed protein product, partial [Meganyctiphanes norvegica]